MTNLRVNILDENINSLSCGLIFWIRERVMRNLISLTWEWERVMQNARKGFQECIL